MTGTGLKYEMGEALAVYGHNKAEEVEEFLSWYKINPTSLVFMQHHGKSLLKCSKLTFSESTEIRTCFQIFQQYLDVFGRPAKKFYQELAEYANKVLTSC